MTIARAASIMIHSALHAHHATLRVLVVVIVLQHVAHSLAIKAVIPVVVPVQQTAILATQTLTSSLTSTENHTVNAVTAGRVMHGTVNQSAVMITVMNAVDPKSDSVTSVPQAID